MRKIQEVLRLKFEQHRGHREIAASCGIGAATVSEYVRRARDSGSDWEQAQRLSDAELEARLFPKDQYGAAVPRIAVDYAYVHRELRRTGVTLQLLWSEYVEAAHSAADEESYQYCQFCARYLRWRSKLDVVMRQLHRAGEKAFIDYSGNRPSVIDAVSGEVREMELFVMVLGASSYTFAEATRSQKVGDFTASIVRGIELYGGVPEILVPDQLRSAVKGPDRYDPDNNATLLDLARHYCTTIIPARPRIPRDKAKVEAGVLVVQRWILARLRNRSFFNLEELNVAISQLVDELNARAFRKLHARSIGRSHKDYGKWRTERLVGWATTFGEHVTRVVDMTLAAYPRPEMGYRPVLGILRTAEIHGAQRFDAACARALSVSGRTAPRRKYIEAILKQRLELAPLANSNPTRAHGHHDNVRGRTYYKENTNAD